MRLPSGIITRPGTIAAVLSALAVNGGCATTSGLNAGDVPRCEALLPATSTWVPTSPPQGQALRDLGAYVIPPRAKSQAGSMRRIGWYSSSAASGEKRYAACTVDSTQCGAVVSLVAAEHGVTLNVDSGSDVTFWTILGSTTSRFECQQ